jgi:hypothetical protein
MGFINAGVRNLAWRWDPLFQGLEQLPKYHYQCLRVFKAWDGFQTAGRHSAGQATGRSRYTALSVGVREKAGVPGEL